MRIFLHEISELDTDLDFTEENPWVLAAVERVDEKLDEPKRPSAAPKAKSKPRPVQVHFNLRNVDDVIVVSGNIDTTIQLVCSRCANPFAMSCKNSFSALFCKDPVMAGIAHLQKGLDRNDPGKPVGQNKGFARHAHDESSEGGTGLANMDLDITYLSNDFIELGDVLTEQLQLQVPFQPLCKEDCKGVCLQCGADLNVGRCACKKITNNLPFSVLRDFKV